MKTRFKRVAWKIYEAEYKLFNSNKKPNPKISLCKISWNILGLGVALIIVCFIILITVVAVSLIASGVWFVGFSPQPYRWLFQQTDKGVPFWKFQQGNEGDSKKYYKINKRFAPWEIAIFPLILLALVFDLILKQTGVLLPQKTTVSRMSKWASSPIWFLPWLFYKLASWIFVKSRGMRCPIPLDFSDVAGIKETLDGAATQASD